MSLKKDQRPQYIFMAQLASVYEYLTAGINDSSHRTIDPQIALDESSESTW